MKWIKLYEEFVNDELDMIMTRILEDSGVEFIRYDEFCSDELIIYKVNNDEYWETINQEERENIEQNIKDLKEIINDLGWELTMVVNRFVFHKGNLNESIKSWLNENYGELRFVEKKKGGKKRFYYVDQSGYPVIFSNENQPKVFYVDATKLGISRNTTIFSILTISQLNCIKILKEWLSEKYQLNDIEVYLNSGGWGNVAGSKINWSEKII
jgi:hypothetical protein